MKDDKQNEELYDNNNEVRNGLNGLSQINIQLNSLSQNLDNFKCLKNQQAIMMCCSQICDKIAPLCGIKKCQCKKQHQKCLNYFHFQHFLNVFKNKSSKKQQLMTQIQQLFDKMIDQISNLRDKAIQAANFIYFNAYDYDFLEKLKSFDNKLILGKDLYHCSFNKSIQYTIEKQNKNLSTIRKSLKAFQTKVKTQIDLFEGNLFIEKIMMKKSQQNVKVQRNLSIHQVNSQILTNQQIQTLQGFFPKTNIKEITLLYRASSNQFSTKKFWDLCTNIPNTIVVILTQKHKVIGGYSPVAWKKNDHSFQQADPSGESFIFSITQGEVYRLKNNNHAIYYFNQNWGPQFGKLCNGDLSISDKCNIQASSFCFYGNEYDNDDNVNIKDKIQKFNGQKDQYFKIIEWQVFQLIF